MSPKMWNIGNYRAYKLGVALDIENQSSIPPSHFLSSVYTLQGLRGMFISPKSWTYSQCIPELGHNLMNCPRNMQLRLEINPGFSHAQVSQCLIENVQLLSLSYSLPPHGLQPARLPYPSLSPRACSNSCPLSQGCHPTILPSVIPCSSCLQSSIRSGCSLKVGRTRYGAEFQALPWYYGMSTGRGARTPLFLINWLCELKQCIQVPKPIHSSLNPESWIVL